MFENMVTKAHGGRRQSSRGCGWLRAVPSSIIVSESGGMADEAILGWILVNALLMSSRQSPFTRSSPVNQLDYFGGKMTFLIQRPKALIYRICRLSRVLQLVQYLDVQCM